MNVKIASPSVEVLQFLFSYMFVQSLSLSLSFASIQERKMPSDSGAINGDTNAVNPVLQKRSLIPRTSIQLYSGGIMGINCCSLHPRSFLVSRNI